MTKTVSVAELAHGGASRAIRTAQQEPVLVSKENRPAAWIVGAETLAQLAEARGAEPGVDERALEMIAVELYQREVLALGRAAKLAGLSLSDFTGLCAKLRVPVLWEPEGGLTAEIDALAATLGHERSHD